MERELQLDPKVAGASRLLGQISNDRGGPDEASKAVKADVAADASNKDRDAAFLLQMGQVAYKGYVTSKKPADYKKAMSYLKASDEVNPTPDAKFYMGVSAFAMLQADAETLQKSHSC